MAKIWREEKQLQPKHDSLWGWSICRNFHSAVKVGSHPTFIFAACHSLLMLREARSERCSSDGLYSGCPKYKCQQIFEASTWWGHNTSYPICSHYLLTYDAITVIMGLMSTVLTGPHLLFMCAGFETINSTEELHFSLFNHGNDRNLKHSGQPYIIRGEEIFYTWCASKHCQWKDKNEG